MSYGKLAAALAATFTLSSAGVSFAHQAKRDTSPTTRDDQQTTRKTTETGEPQQASEDEKKLMEKLHQANQVEMEMGFMAKSNAQSAAVKNYGKMLADDHNAADKKLINLAKQEQVQLLMPKTKEEQKSEAKEMEEMRHMTGVQFDRMFLRKQVEGHDKTINEVESELQKVQDPKLKALMEEMLPKLRHHREMAASLLNKVG